MSQFNMEKRETSSFNEISKLKLAPPITKGKENFMLWKRVIDLIGSVMGLIILIPLFICIALLIKTESIYSPVFFKQKRVGKRGELFNMYKFRSMVCDAEKLKSSLENQNEVTGPVFKMKSDPRVTKVGKFLRKTSIDELPQLLNVLKGEMSLVGPRPALPDEVAQYTDYERQRLTVTPGLTCYWQVSGRSNINFEEWVEMDLEYIKNQCFLVDMILIIRTVFCLFGSRGAY